MRLMALLPFILFGATTTVAMPISEYRTLIHQAVLVLENPSRTAGHESVEDRADRELRALNTVREYVPEAETIEWDGGRVRVDDSWLDEELNSFRKADAPLRAEILARILERLRAVDERLSELDVPRPSASSWTKEQEKAALADISRRDEFKPSVPQESIIVRIWKRFVEWVKSLFPSSSGFGSGGTSWLSFIAIILVFGLAAGVLGYAIWKFAPFFQRRRAKLKLEKRTARIVLGERLSPDQTAADLLVEAEALARKGELRAAIRKGYIALLCELGDRKILTLAEHKTNRDYLRSVREKRPLLDEMQRLTNSFEIHWYGFRQTTAEDWTSFRSGYHKIVSFKF